MHLKVLYWNQCKLDVHIFDVKTLEEFEELSAPSNATLLTISMLFYITQDLQTYFIVCIQYKASTNKGVTTLQAEILVPNQPNFKFLLESSCEILATLSEDTPQWAEKPITKKF